MKREACSEKDRTVSYMEKEKNLIVEKIKERFPQVVQDVYSFREQWFVVVNKKDIFDVCKFLKETPELDFNLLVDLTAIDFPNRDMRFEVVYNLLSISRLNRIILKAKVGLNDLTVPSVTSLWRCANWAEREVYDMFGIKFSGHPDLRRILMPEDFNGYPLRKEFPLEGRE